MKRLLMVIAVVSYVVPAMAADVDFYGRIGMGGWWMKTERFYDDTVDSNVMIDTIPTTTDTTFDTTVTYIFDKDSMPLVSCNWLPYGTFGAKFKGDRFGGCIEFGIHDNTYDATLHGSPTFLSLFEKRGMFVYMKKWYAEWYIHDMFTFLLGQDITPANFFSSNQAFWGGNSFGNIGCLSTGSNPMFQLSVGNQLASEESRHGFSWEGKVAAVKVDTTLILIKNKWGKAHQYKGETRAPKVEGSYEINLDLDFFALNLKAVGGFQRYYSVCFSSKLEADESKITIDSYIFGGDIGIKVGPVSVVYDIFHGQNIGPYGVYIGDAFGWWRKDDYMRVFYPQHEVPVIEGTPVDSLSTMKNGKVTEMALVLNVKPLDFLSFEAGLGGIIGDHEYKLYKELWPCIIEHDETKIPFIWRFGTIAWYFQTELTILEHLVFTPEIGQYIFGPFEGFGRYLYWGFHTGVEF